jgi:hypothetical protein
MNIDPAGAQALLLPAGVQLDPASSRTFSQTLQQGPDRSGAAVEAALEVDVDIVWQVRPAAVAALVDAVGGIVVDVDRQIAVGTVLITPARDQRLSGAQAAAYAVYRGTGEPEQARLARTSRVLSALLPALPLERAKVLELVRGLSTSSVTNGSAEQLAGMLAGLRAGTSSTRGLPAQGVPVRAGARGAMLLMGQEAVALARQRMPSAAATSAPATQAAQVRVRVLNGDGRPGLGAAAVTRLKARGFVVVGAGSNPATLGRPRTVVWVGAGGAAAQATGEAVAQALGLPDGAVLVQAGADADSQAPDAAGAQVVVVVGADFAQDVATEGV